MKKIKQLTALMLALVMALTLVACGGSDSSSDTKEDTTLGKYIGHEVDVFGDGGTPMSELYDGECYIELKDGGKGEICLDGDKNNITWAVDADGAFTMTLSGQDSKGTLADGVITLNDLFGVEMKLTFVKEGGGTSAQPTGNTGSLNDYADIFGGDWHGMYCFTAEATGIYEAFIDEPAHEMLARLVFDGLGGCAVWMAVPMQGDNEYNFQNMTVSLDPEEPDILRLNGEFLGEPIVNGYLATIDGAMGINVELDDGQGNYVNLIANLRHLDDENWPDPDTNALSLPAAAVEHYRGMSFLAIANTYNIDMGAIPYSPDDHDTGTAGQETGSTGSVPNGYPFEKSSSNGQGEYGMSNANATGLVTLDTLKHMYTTFFALKPGEWGELTYADVKEIMGGVDGLPRTCEEEKWWNSAQHTYTWFTEDGDFYTIRFDVKDGNEFQSTTSYSSKVDD